MGYLVAPLCNSDVALERKSCLGISLNAIAAHGRQIAPPIRRSLVVSTHSPSASSSVAVLPWKVNGTPELIGGC